MPCYVTSEEYILIENRQQNKFDINFWTSGIVMYHIDEDMIDQSFVGMPGQEGWPENGNHYRVAVIQADGNYDLENNRNLGDDGDIWKPGMTLGPNEDGDTYPNTDSYQMGYVMQTGITIEIGESRGTKASFKVDMGSRGMFGGFGAPEKQDAEGATEEEDPPLVDIQPQKEAGLGDQISGKIPQLGWYQEAMGEEETTVFSEPIRVIDPDDEAELAAGGVASSSFIQSSSSSAAVPPMRSSSSVLLASCVATITSIGVSFCF
jgi:hypothetical protein